MVGDGNGIVGDVAMNFLRFTGIKRRPIFAQNIKTVFECWQNLIDHGAKPIFLAHGKSFDVKDLIRYSQKFAKS